MYLKAIELHGFKSFPDKTKITFEKGMSAVVGPNGSGKSNISDAIRWVLGETRSKELRGSGKMEDIIFGGTQKRSPMGFASVSLILDNTQRNFDVDNNEVAVTRKYYRGGESEYQINGNRVRLKDIYELFLDTGLGRNGYSIVGQGKISEIVTAKPEGRREIFEEASGIAKFRYRKNEAEKSLAHAQENILRLTDILMGLEERVEPLEKESKKAKEFLTLANQKKGMEISLWMATVDQSKEMVRQQQRKLEIFQQDYDKVEENLEESEKYLEKRYFESNGLIAKNDENMAFIRLTEQDISAQNANKAVLNSQISYNAQRVQTLEQELDGFEREWGNVFHQRQILQEKTQTLIEQKNAKLAQQNAVQASLEELSQKAQQSDGEKGQLIAKTTQIAQQLQDYKISLYGLDTQDASFSQTLQANKQQLGQTQEYIAQTQGQITDLQEFITSAKETVLKNQNIKNGLQLKLKTLQDKMTQAQQLIFENQNRQKEIHGRVRLLTDMENSMEGFAHSVKTVLQQGKQGSLGGILGSVAQIIQVEKGYETAVEIALGYALQNIVVENETSAKRAMEFLKQNRGGRATFLPLDTMKPAVFKETLPDWAKTGDSVIQAEDCFKNVISSLLGRTIIVEDINQASRLSKSLNYRYRVVTLDGQQINAGGSFTGGSVSKSAGLFTRKSEIEKLKNEMLALQKEIPNLEKACQTVQNSLDEVNSQISACEGEIQVLVGEAQNAQVELAKHQQMLNQYQAAYQLQQAALETAQKGLEENQILRIKAQNETKDLQNALQNIESQLESLGEIDTQTMEQQNITNQQLQQLRLEIVDITGQIQLAEYNLSQVDQQQQTQLQRKQKLLDDLQLLKQENLQKEQQIVDLEQAIENMKKTISEKEEENKSFILLRMEIEQERNQILQSNKRLSEEKENLSRQIAKIAERIATMETAYDEIITKLWEEYELTVQSAREFVIDLPDENQAKKDLAVIKGAIKRLGHVNVGAIEEYKEVFEKYQFLKSQLTDLELSKNQLNKLITSLNGEMRTLFSQSFEIINNNFSKIFQELFGGGSAQLKLTDEQNILESGIEIEVSPPGKVIKSLAALSGGEQALVAISIYFAILAHNPSPFCILDEIEAALDDVNVTRYANYLHRIADQTQFIVITHRRGTMEAADVLYGVTMQEDGISKLLKLDIENLSPSLIN